MILASALLAAHLSAAVPERSFTKASLFGPLECKVEEAPRIEVSVKTDEIDYDYSKTTQQLGMIGTGTASPYPPGADTATGGLRSDHPTIATKIGLDIIYNKWKKAGCVRYKTVNVEMHLSPKIYIAREYDTGTCRNAVLTHELKHVKVDREVANKYAGAIARVLQDVVNRTGAIGPFDMANIEAAKAQASGTIETAMDRVEKSMEAELKARQQEVDSLDEYRQVGNFCKNVRVGR